jgi:hypothetical protein
MRALDQFFDRLGSRISFRRETNVPRSELLEWCYRQALSGARPLPAVFNGEEQNQAAGLIDPRWVGEESLRMIADLQLGEPVVLRILDLITNGSIPIPDRVETGPVAAARELLRPAPPKTAEELRAKVVSLYPEHERFMKVQPSRWLALLDRVATAELAVAPEMLDAQLARHLDAQWVVVDCLGLPLADTVARVAAECMPSREAGPLQFAIVNERTSTDAFYVSLLDREFNKAFKKINAIDNLIHERALDYCGLQRLAAAELEIAIKRLMPRLDPGKPVLLFGDHGFRLARDGKGFTHGASSTLERLTALTLLR